MKVRAALFLLASLLPLSACEGDDTPSLRVRVTSDLLDSQEIDTLGVLVTSNDLVVLDEVTPLTLSPTYPITLVPTSGAAPPTVHVRVFGLKGEAVRVLRQAFVTLPKESPVVLELPLVRDNLGSATGTLGAAGIIKDAFDPKELDFPSPPIPTITAACDAGQTMIAGKCASAVIDVARLPHDGDPGLSNRRIEL